jgi:hypothetical protein
VGLEESLNIRVEVEDEQLVQTNEPGHNVQSHEFHFEPLVGSFQRPEQLFSESLRVVDEVQGREIKTRGLCFFLLLLLDQGLHLLQLLISFPALLVESV